MLTFLGDLRRVRYGSSSNSYSKANAHAFLESTVLLSVVLERIELEDE